MPVNLSASGNLALGRIFDDDIIDGDDGKPSGDDAKEARQKKITAGDLQDVANLFEIRKKTKK
jgi:hypothetical protein